MTSFFEELVDVGVALGNGIYSVGEDLVWGIERTAQGLGVSGYDRITEIGVENERLYQLIKDAYEYGTGEKGPLYKAVKIVLIEYYSTFPEEALKMIAKEGGVAVGFMSGRMVIGTTIAREVTKRILLKIAASKGFKLLATKLGLSTATAISGVATLGITTVIGGLMFQGVFQRSSKAAKRLQQTHPIISQKLKQHGNLDLLYFLIEGPMEKHLSAIREARLFPSRYTESIKKVYAN